MNANRRPYVSVSSTMLRGALRLFEPFTAMRGVCLDIRLELIRRDSEAFALEYVTRLEEEARRYACN